jgi:invasion protein IalB
VHTIQKFFIVAMATVFGVAPLYERARAQTSKASGATKADAPQAVDAEPQTTSAGFGDWALRCQRLGVGADEQRICEVAQTIQMQGQTVPIAQLAFGRLKKSEPLRFTAVLPVNVAFQSAPKVTTNDKEPATLELPWQKCMSGGCFATAEVKDEILRRWRVSSGAGQIQFKDALGRDVSLAISFRGLAQALDALAKEPIGAEASGSGK